MRRYQPIPITPIELKRPALQTTPSDSLSIGRRAFLKIMAASAALASAACSGPPQEKIVPYVQMPELMTLGQPLFYATAFMRRGLAHGVLVESNMGRPTKVEGNRDHPASLGATDVFAQAAVLQLWDPDRSQTVYNGNVLSTWEAFKTALLQQRSEWERNGGASMRILTGTVTSPTLADQLATLLKQYPNARWHRYDPLHDDNAWEAAQLAFGRPVDQLFQLDRADLVVTLDADIFGDWPGSTRYARDFTRKRKSDAPAFSNRLYAIDATATLTGAMADHRLAVSPQQLEQIAWRMAAQLGVPGVPREAGAQNGYIEKWESTLVKQLSSHRGRSLIVAGGTVSPSTRALVHKMNAHLGNAGNTVVYVNPIEADPSSHAESIKALAADMHAGSVKTLFMIGANPVYSAPSDVNFADALKKVPFSAQLALYRDETAHAATWHVPQCHDFEQWSDGRAYDGTASIVQPVIAPLYGGRSAHELMALLANGNEHSGYALVRRYWQQHGNASDFEQFWQSVLQQGLVPNSASSALQVRPAASLPAPQLHAAKLQAVFVADPSADDGHFANNAWLQELPRPFTKLTWDNAALISVATAKSIGVETGDVVRLRLAANGQTTIEVPIWILPEQPDHVVTLPLGYGRRAAGNVGNGVGFNAYLLRTLAAMRGPVEVTMEPTGRQHTFATTQNHATVEGRDIVRMATLAEFMRNPHFATDAEKERVPDVSLYPEWEYKDYKWGMAIDLNACIGCNACTIACQAENNIPVVGKEDVIHGREMHWIRVDRYVTSFAGRQRTAFQPVPCMHCETAPCEEVCPVGATVHDSEGLNVQVYNRCVGTRFCSNNCPYKVRRFNFLQFSNTKIESLKAVQNPEVTVRRRGVMEKCTYCLQRITRARTDAEKLGRRIRDGEVVTACQAVCPTEAIVFGDLNDPNSRVNRAKASPLDYALLSEFNTRPRTTYAARVVNLDPELE
jgi:molybdopterin-containing oxidoreductase family iron-sulfur binding subunit